MGESENNLVSGVPKVGDNKSESKTEIIQRVKTAFFDASGEGKKRKSAEAKWDAWEKESDFSLELLIEIGTRKGKGGNKDLNKIFKGMGLIDTRSSAAKKKNAAINAEVPPKEAIIMKSEETLTNGSVAGTSGPFLTADENISEKSAAPEPVAEPAPTLDPSPEAEVGPDTENGPKIPKHLTSKEFHDKYGHIYRETLFKESSKGEMIAASWKSIESYNAKKGEVKLSGFSMTKDGFTGIKYVQVDKLDEELDGFKLKTNEKKEPIEKISVEEFNKEFVGFIGKRSFYARRPDKNKWIEVIGFVQDKGAWIMRSDGPKETDKWKGYVSVSDLREILKKYKLTESVSEEIDKASPEELKEIERRNKAVLDAADYTFSKMDEGDVKELNVKETDPKKAIEKSNEIFIEKTRKLWKEFAAHRLLKNGKFVCETDLDGQAFLKLLQLAGFNVSDVKYLKHGDHCPGGISGDASGEHGVVLKINGEEYSLIIDHHADESKRDSSTAKFTYKLLVDYGLLKKDEHLEKFVDYVTLQDNQTYIKDEVKDLFNSKNDKKRYANKYARTIMGLQKNLNTDEILDLLREVKDFRKDELPKEVLENYKVKDKKTGEEKTLLELSLEAEKKMNIARKEIIAMGKNGFKISTGRDQHGDVLVDTGKLIIGDADNKELYFSKVPSGWRMLPARAAGYGAYVAWLPEVGKVQVYTEKPLGDVKFSKKGVNVRGNYWFYNGEEGEKLPPEMLEEILTKLSGKEYKIGGELKEVMEKEEKPREEIRAYAKQAAEIKEKIWDIFNPKKFTKDRVGEEIEGEAKKIEANLREIIFGQIGKNKKFKNWPEKIEAFRETEKTVNEFISRVVGNKKETAQEAGELSEEENKFINDFYVELAKTINAKLQTHFTVDNKYKEEKIPERIEEEMERFWEFLPEKMQEDNKKREGEIIIRQEKIPAAVEKVKELFEKK